MVPGDHSPAFVEAGLEAVRRGGLEVAVDEIVFAGPEELHRRLQPPRDLDRFEVEVPTEATAEAATGEQDVHGDRFEREAQGARRVGVDGVGGLGRRPDLAASIRDATPSR